MLLLDRGANIVAKDNIGATALHSAVMFGRLNIVSLLVSRGANINAQDRQGRTPLHWAATTGKYEIAAQLLKLGADTGVTDNDGQTPAQATRLADLLDSTSKERIISLFQNDAPVSPPRQVGNGALSCSDVEGLAQRIKASNPSIDGATLFEAIKQSQILMGCRAPDAPSPSPTHYLATPSPQPTLAPPMSGPQNTTCMPFGVGGTRCTTLTPGKPSTYTTCMPFGNGGTRCTSQ